MFKHEYRQVETLGYDFWNGNIYYAFLKYYLKYLLPRNFQEKITQDFSIEYKIIESKKQDET